MLPSYFQTYSHFARGDSQSAPRKSSLKDDDIPIKYPTDSQYSKTNIGFAHEGSGGASSSIDIPEAIDSTYEDFDDRSYSTREKNGHDTPDWMTMYESTSVSVF